VIDFCNKMDSRHAHHYHLCGHCHCGHLHPASGSNGTFYYTSLMRIQSNLTFLWSLTCFSSCTGPRVSASHPSTGAEVGNLVLFKHIYSKPCLLITWHNKPVFPPLPAQVTTTVRALPR
jgi:hypothetical protein